MGWDRLPSVSPPMMLADAISGALVPFSSEPSVSLLDRTKAFLAACGDHRIAIFAYDAPKTVHIRLAFTSPEEPSQSDALKLDFEFSSKGFSWNYRYPLTEAELWARIQQELTDYCRVEGLRSVFMFGVKASDLLAALDAGGLEAAQQLAVRYKSPIG